MPHDPAAPPLQGHPLGLPGERGIRRAVRPAKAAEMGACGVYADQGHEQAGGVGADGDRKVFHGSTLPDAGQA